MALAHVAYGLRGDASEGDFRFVERLAAEHGLPFFSCRAEGAPSAGIQLWARRVRRRYFATLAEAGWAIALAHHEDDVAETALMRLARGASPGKLHGMRVWQAPIWRPLLRTRKAELLAFLEENALSYRLDASNAERDYARNVLRHDVLPVLENLHPGAAARIAATAREARVIELWFREAAEAALASTGACLLAFFRDTPQDRAALALGAWITSRLPGMQLSRRLLDAAVRRIGNLAATSDATILDLPEGRRLAFSDGRLTITDLDTAKAPRAAQHRRQLARGDLPAVLLAPGSYAVLRRGRQYLRLSLAKHATEPARVTLRVPTGKKFKTLFQRWNVSDEAREEYLTIEYNGDLIGLFDGHAFDQPPLSITREPFHG